MFCCQPKPKAGLGFTDVKSPAQMREKHDTERPPSMFEADKEVFAQVGFNINGQTTGTGFDSGLMQLESGRGVVSTMSTARDSGVARKSNFRVSEALDFARENHRESKTGFLSFFSNVGSIRVTSRNGGQRVQSSMMEINRSRNPEIGEG